MDTGAVDEIQMVVKKWPKRLTAMEFLQKISGPKVDIYVGAENKHYNVPKDLLCYYSKYFDRCFNGNFKEGREQKLTLAEDNPDDFEILLEYVVQGVTTSRKWFSSDPTRVDVTREIISCSMQFVRFADRYDLGDASAVICGALRTGLEEGFGICTCSERCHDDEDYHLTCEEIEEICMKTSPQNPLRRLMAEIVIRSDGLREADKFRVLERSIEGFAAEVLDQFRMNRHPEAIMLNDPWDKDGQLHI